MINRFIAAVPDDAPIKAMLFNDLDLLFEMCNLPISKLYLKELIKVEAESLVDNIQSAKKAAEEVAAKKAD